MNALFYLPVLQTKQFQKIHSSSPSLFFPFSVKILFFPSQTPLRPRKYQGLSYCYKSEWFISHLTTKKKKKTEWFGGEGKQLPLSLLNCNSNTYTLESPHSPQNIPGKSTSGVSPHPGYYFSNFLYYPFPIIISLK